MSMLPLSYQVVGTDDYMLEISIDATGAFFINAGDHTSHKPRHGTLTSDQRERLLKLLQGLGESRDDLAPAGAPGFIAHLTLGEGPGARRFNFWEGALEELPTLKAVVREIQVL